jgi:hypothetical protein
MFAVEPSLERGATPWVRHWGAIGTDGFDAMATTVHIYEVQ